MSQYHRNLPGVAAHELNGALHALGTFLELADGASDPRQLHEHLHMARACVARCREISSTMQAFELLGGHASEVDLRPLCADAAQRHRAEVELPSGPLRAHTDAQTLQASLDALLVRARRQSRTRTRLSLTATERGVRLDVEDDGPPPVLPRGVEVDPFAPGAPAGLGRGLEMLLARSFIERGDGALRVGVGPLGGARVVLDLPGIVR